MKDENRNKDFGQERKEGPVSAKVFWADQVVEGLKQYPKKATPTIQKLGASIYDPEESGFEQFDMATPSVPPIVEFRYIPVIGTPANDTDPSNLDGVFSNILATLRQHCTTAYNYDQGSLAAAILSAGTIPMLLAHVKRRLKALYTYNLGSNLSADDIWEPFSDGYSAQHDKVDALNDMDTKISLMNDIASVYNSIAPPNFFPVFRRWEEMETEVFRDLDDDPNGCAQLFFFSADGYYFPVWNEDPQNPGYVLEWNTYRGEIMTELHYIYDLAKKIQNEQDFVQIYGDICKVYGDSRYLIPEVEKNVFFTEDMLKEGIVSKYDYDVLVSLYHGTVLPVEPKNVMVDARTGKLSGSIDFKSNVKSDTVLFTIMKKWLTLPKIYNAQKFDEDMDHIAITTPWMIVDKNYGLHGGLSAVGTEVLCGMRIWYYFFPAGVRTLASEFRDSSLIAPWGTNAYDENLYSVDNRDLVTLGRLKSWAYSPMMPVVYYEVTGDRTQVTHATMINPDCEEEYPCFMPYSVLKQWHSALRWRLWGMPHLIQFTEKGKAVPYWTR